MRKVKSSNSSMLNVLESKQEIIRNWGLILFLRVSSNLAISHLDVYLHMRSTNYFLISPGTFIFSAIEGFWANWSKYSRRMDWSRSIPQSSHEQTGRWWINRPSLSKTNQIQINGYYLHKWKKSSKGKDDLSRCSEEFVMSVLVHLVSLSMQATLDIHWEHTTFSQKN